MSKNGTHKTFRVSRQGGSLVIECEMKKIVVYEREQILPMILPTVVLNGEELTFEIRKVENA